MGSGSNSAQREAEAAERQRQQQINASVGQINSVFDSPARQAQYADYLAAARQLYGDRLADEQGKASRQLKFSLGRSGQTGGSLAVDQGRELGRSFQRGTIEADRLAQADEGALRQTDQDSRLRLIGMAQNGLDATTGVSNASAALRSNLQAGASTRNVQSISDLFSRFSDIYRKSADAKATRQGQQWGLNGIFAPSPFFGGSNGN